MSLQITGNNMNGSPELVLSGGNCNTFAWSPFGGRRGGAGNGTSLPGFNGERQDPLSGVTHLGNGYRAYSPALRRFTCPDSESPFGGGGINPYVYCNHDSVNNTDPSGHMISASATVKAARRIEREREMARKMANSMPLGLMQTPKRMEEIGVSEASQKSSGMASQLLQDRSAPANPVQGITPQLTTDYEMAPAYVWAVSHKQIQRASPRTLDFSVTQKLISKYVLHKDFFSREVPEVKLAFDLYKGRTEEFVADKLDELISSLGTSLDIPLYRGLPQKVVGEVGGVVKEKRFTAASTNLDVAEKFAEQSMGNRVIEIVGGRPLKIPNVFQKPGGNEFEYLYARNTQFRVSYNYDTGMIKYTAIT